MFRSSLHAIRGFAAWLLWCAAAAMPVFGAQPADMESRRTAGETEEALARLDGLLAQRPRDPHLRFDKAMVLLEMQRRSEAFAALSELAIDYPEIPEVHNNLAVLHAAEGDYPKARNELEAALRANPGYAVAHQNLGDVYVQLARQSYQQALHLDPSNAALSRKLTLLRELVQPIGTALSTRPPP